jgi:hypothetical protein
MESLLVEKERKSTRKAFPKNLDALANSPIKWVPVTLLPRQRLT